MDLFSASDRDDDDGDDDGSHVEGLQFLAERDMKSLHRVSDLWQESRESTGHVSRCEDSVLMETSQSRLSKHGQMTLLDAAYTAFLNL